MAKTIQIPLDLDTRGVFDSIAEAMDVDTSTLLRAALTGLSRSGQVERFVEAAIKADPDIAARMARRRARHSLWTKEPGSSPPPAAAVWRRDSWTLRYIGAPTSARLRAPGEGWHLYGPGVIHTGMYMDHVREDAQEKADHFIARHLRPKVKEDQTTP